MYHKDKLVPGRTFKV